jgi:enoyl-[acyl-carrier protein] reductase II
MKTRITELFGVEYPIVLSAMMYVSVPKLVAAVSNAGGFGLLASANVSNSEEEVKKAIREVKEMTDKPFGVNIPMLLPERFKVAKVCQQEGIKVVNTSIGNPAELMGWAKEAKMTVIHTCGSLGHAMKLAKHGIDGVIVAGSEGGGHTGFVGTMVLIPDVADKVKVPIIAAGGIADARSFAAALCLGADGVAMGTRFAMTQESPVPENIKQRMLKATADDTFASDMATGFNARALVNNYVQRLMTYRKGASSWEKFLSAIKLSRKLGIKARDIAPLGRKALTRKAESTDFNMTMVPGFERIRRAYQDADADEGFLLCGQVAGRCDNIPTVKDVVLSVVSNVQAVVEGANAKIKP